MDTHGAVDVGEDARRHSYKGRRQRPGQLIFPNRALSEHTEGTMKLQKRLLATLFAGLLMFGVAACEGDTAGDTGTDTTTDTATEDLGVEPTVAPTE